MVNISRSRLSNNLLEQLFYMLFEVLGRSRDHEAFIKTVNNLFSPKERIMFAKRVMILYLLLKGIEQTIISRILKVSKTTVNKYAPMVEKNSDEMRFIYQKILKNAAITDFVLKIFDILYPPGVPGTNWGRGWQRRREIERRKLTGLP